MNHSVLPHQLEDLAQHIQSSITGMRTRQIHSTPSWQRQGLQHDCALVVEDQDKLRIQGMIVIRIKLFFSFTHNAKTYTCAFIEWFKCDGPAKIAPSRHKPAPACHSAHHDPADKGRAGEIPQPAIIRQTDPEATL